MKTQRALQPYERRVLVVDITNGDQVVEEIIDIRKAWAGFVLVDTVMANPDQPRKLFDTDELKLLAGSIESTLQVSSIVAVLYSHPEDKKILWMINDGERRLRAMKMIEGKCYIWISYSPFITIENIFMTSTVANLCRKGHTYMENANAIENLVNKFGFTEEQVARQMGFEIAWIKQLRCMIRLHPTLQCLLDEPTPKKDRVPFDAALALSNLTHEEQLLLWEKAQQYPKRQMSVVIKALKNDQGKTGTAGRRGRRPSDNAKIASGKVSSIKTFTRRAIELPDLLFDAIDKSKIPGLVTEIEELHVLLDQLRTKFECRLPKETPTESAKKETLTQPKVRAQIKDRPALEKPRRSASTAPQEHQIKALPPARPLPPSPNEIKPPVFTEPARGTPAILPRPEEHEDPDVVLQRRKRELGINGATTKSPKPKFVPVAGIDQGTGLSPIRRILTAEEIIKNMQRERAAAQTRIAPHQKRPEPLNTLAGLTEGQGFTNRDFPDDGDMAHHIG
jgi:ParB/RepB/Spo0J family partition protein